MATAPTDIEFSGFTKFLILNGLLTESEAKIHSQEAQKKKIPLLSYLVANKLVDCQVVATKASIEYGIPFFDLNAIDHRSLPINLINEKLIRKHQALPLFHRGKTLFIAQSDPTNLQALDEIKFQSRLHPETILVEEDKLIYNELMRWMKSKDVSHDAPALPVNTGDKEPKDKKRPVKPKEEPKFNIHAAWVQWYNILRERHPDVLMPNKLRPDEAGMVKILLEDYGEDGTREIFRVAVLDWDAFKTAHQKRDLPIAPDLKTVVAVRRELAVAVSQKGITTTTQRVSKYGQKTGGAFDNWEK